MIIGAPFKPRDLAVTKAGRPCRILEVLPDHHRRVAFTDSVGGMAVVHTSELAMVRSALVRPWKEHRL